MAPHEWILVVGLAVLGIAEAVLHVSAMRAQEAARARVLRGARMSGNR